MNLKLQVRVSLRKFIGLQKQLGGLKAPMLFLVYFIISTGISLVIMIISNILSNRLKPLIFSNLLLFSPNTPITLQNSICVALKVKLMCPNDKYLGLPSVYGRKNGELSGWKQKFLSQAGCEVSIKSIIQAIPTYARQCYLLAKGFLNKLMVYVRRFFWGGDSHERHIHWKSWEKLTDPKVDDGIGFRNLEAFNKSLLAKQWLRLL
ncbi:hypothetical protein CTI12_AA534180 [Artemisia annua]|uniref:RNA-directed DNA polymerase, eukaryota, Reverse transcriptase zinc-binding domain protein n=1 Tax=Artemisia annua TaxID=35608 RepID=A0A2U1L3K1_ARTAN|nr:hypothetical protein CTI12_AA534180 [Artemisia annua]